MTLKIIKIVAGAFSVNCYIIYSETTKEGIVVDPGGDTDRIIKAIDDNKIIIKKIILTHGHGDHIGAVSELKNKYDIPVSIHENDLIMAQDANINLSYMMPMGATHITPDEVLKDGDMIEVGDMMIEVIHTPGHTPGCISLKVGKHLFTGDTLFKGSIGRTDLPNGDFDQIITSIRERLLVLEDDTIVLPGHGESSTIFYEKMYNSFLN